MPPSLARCSATSAGSFAGLDAGQWAPCTPFYIDESTDVAMPGLASCFDNYNHLDHAALRVDDHVIPRYAQYLADLHLLWQLRAHPSRVHDPGLASIHFTGILPMVSFVAQHDGHCQQQGGSHAARMTRAAVALSHKLAQLKPGDSRMYVLVATSHDLNKVLGDLYPLLETPLGRKHLVLAGSDLFFSTPHIYGHSRNVTSNYVTMPYVASYRIDELARHPDETCNASTRDRSFFFAGTMDRQNLGSSRASIMFAMANASTNRLVINHAEGLSQKHESLMKASGILRDLTSECIRQRTRTRRDTLAFS